MNSFGNCLLKIGQLYYLVGNQPERFWSEARRRCEIRDWNCEYFKGVSTFFQEKHVAEFSRVYYIVNGEFLETFELESTYINYGWSNGYEHVSAVWQVMVIDGQIEMASVGSSPLYAESNVPLVNLAEMLSSNLEDNMNFLFEALVEATSFIKGEGAQISMLHDGPWINEKPNRGRSLR